MATPATVGPLRHREGQNPRRPAIAVVTLVAAIGLAIVLGAGEATGDIVPILAIIAFAVVVLLLFVSRRFGTSLAVCMVYIACIDGVVRLTTGSSTITLARDVLLYAVVAGILARQVRERRAVDLPPLSILVLLWIVVVVVQVLNPDGQSISHSVASLRPHLEFVPLFFLGYWVMRSRRRLVWFLALLGIVGALNGVVSFVQFNLTPDQLAAWGPGYRDRVFGIGCVNASRGECLYTGRLLFNPDNPNGSVRPFGLGSDLGFGGAVGMLALPALLALRGSARRRLPLQLLLIVLLAGVSAAIITSQARAAVVGGVVAVLAFLGLTVTSRRALRTVGGLAVAGAIGYAVVTAAGSAGGPGALSHYNSLAPSNVVGYSYGYRKSTYALIPTYIGEFPFGAGLGSVGPAALSSTTQRTLNGESEPTFLVGGVGNPRASRCVDPHGACTRPDDPDQVIPRQRRRHSPRRDRGWCRHHRRPVARRCAHRRAAALALLLVRGRNTHLLARGSSPSVGRHPTCLPSSAPWCTAACRDGHRPRGHRRRRHGTRDPAPRRGLLRRGWHVRVIARRCDVAASPRLRFVRVAGPRRPFPLGYPWFWLVGGVLLHRHRVGLVHGVGANAPQRMDVLTVHFLHRAAQRRASERHASVPS